MAEDASSILLVGGGSRIAAALMPRLGRKASCISRRRIGYLQEFLVSDYDRIPPSALKGAQCVVNCVGISAGDAATLSRINIDMPRSLANAARAAGVRHLIHISSFSVYGRANEIDHRTRPAPTSAYGCSKLAGDAALLALADERFAVTILRLPLVYAPGALGKLGQLLRIWKRARMLPVPVGGISRAMIGVDLAAEVILGLTKIAHTGVVFAADPCAFTYAEAAQARAELLCQFPVPRFITQGIESVVPAIGSRLFADSRLVPSENLAIRYGLESRLYHDIATADLQQLSRTG